MRRYSPEIGEPSDGFEHAECQTDSTGDYLDRDEVLEELAATWASAESFQKLGLIKAMLTLGFSNDELRAALGTSG